MSTLPNNNFVRIALAVMKDAVQVDSTWPPQGRNIFELVPGHLNYGLPVAHYLNVRELPDSRVLDVRFSDLYVDSLGDAYNSLEIKLQPSETNPVGLHTREKCSTPVPKTHVPKLARYGGIFSWLPYISEGPVIGEPVLEVFYQLDGPERWVCFHLEYKFKGRVDMEKIRKGEKDDNPARLSPLDVDEINSRYQRLTSEVLAVLQGNADTITVS